MIIQLKYNAKTTIFHEMTWEKINELHYETNKYYPLIFEVKLGKNRKWYLRVKYQKMKKILYRFPDGHEIMERLLWVAEFVVDELIRTTADNPTFRM